MTLSSGATFEALASPPTIDDIVTALNENKIECSKNVRAVASLLNLKPVQQFNFGPVSLETIREVQAEALQFIQYGVFQLPYEVCMYRCTMNYDNRAVGLAILMLDGRRSDAGKEERDGIASVCFIHSREYVCAFHSINMLRTKLGPEGIAVELQIPDAEVKYWRPILLPPGESFDASREETQQMTEGSLVGMGLTMILNTKGIYKERMPYAEKPNAKRVKAGKPPLPYITRVSTALYNRAVEKGEPGTHASPRPHRRRAHLRHYPASGRREAYVLPIAAMLVNWDGQPLEERKGYEVK